MKIILSILIGVSSAFALNFNFINSTVGNGKTTLIEIDKEKNVIYSKIVSDKKEYKLYQSLANTNKMYAFIPISYYEKPHNKKFKIFYEEAKIKKSKIVSLKIKDGKEEQEE